jgi:hypothetical protein
MQFFDSSAIVRLDVTKLAEEPVAGRAVSWLGIRATNQIPQTIYAATSPAFEQCGKGFKSNARRGTNYIEPPIVFPPWIRKPSTKSCVCPLEKQICDCTEERIPIHLLFLYFNAVDLTEPILIVLKNGTRKELIKNLSLPARKRHQAFSPSNHWSSVKSVSS